LFSPVPTQTMFGSDGATHTLPMETVVSRSNWWMNVTPLFVVLSNPPPAVATQYMLGSDSTTVRSTMRPPIPAGPIERHVSAPSHLASSAISFVAEDDLAPDAGEDELADCAALAFVSPRFNSLITFVNSWSWRSTS